MKLAHTISLSIAAIVFWLFIQFICFALDMREVAVQILGGVGIASSIFVIWTR